jgi:hypothetical protein
MCFIESYETCFTLLLLMSQVQACLQSVHTTYAQTPINPASTYLVHAVADAHMAALQ